MVVWWVMFCEIFPHVLTSCFPIKEKYFCFHLSFIQYNRVSIALDLFCLTVVVTMPSAAELSVFISVGGWVKPSSWSAIISGTAVFQLWTIPLTSDSAANASTCLRIVYSVWIEAFYGGRRFGDIFGSVGGELR